MNRKVKAVDRSVTSWVSKAIVGMVLKCPKIRAI